MLESGVGVQKVFRFVAVQMPASGLRYSAGGRGTGVWQMRNVGVDY